MMNTMPSSPAQRRPMPKPWWLGIGLCVLVMAGLAPAHAETTTYIVSNAQGTVVAKMDRDGNVTYTAAYRPYGQQAQGMPQPGPGYTGHVNDPATGLVYMQQRYYDPAVGRFISPDPVVPVPGNVFNFNRFAYANNNPVINTDPDGRDVVFGVDPAGASGNGHTTLYFQDGKGHWYAYSEGARGAAGSSGNLSFLSGQNAPAGVSIRPISGKSIPASGFRIKTTPMQDAKIAVSALRSAKAYNSGKLKYNLYSNNCTDAAVGVVNNAGIGITVDNPWYTVKPNSWIEDIKNDPGSVESTNNDDTSESVRRPFIDDWRHGNRPGQVTRRRFIDKVSL